MAGTALAETKTYNVDGGTISGAVVDGIHVFKGVPFAAPPVGDLRWKAPQPVETWPRTKVCTSTGPMCPQTKSSPLSIYARAPEPQSEDCLYLNIWSGDTAAGAKRPVMVWIHGGSLTRGSGSGSIYDGASLAKKGVVVVTVNYRLNIFGYLAHPELTAESEHNSSGNYGVLDQIAALEWVQRNIKEFGGDPDRVTIFGESAGSWSVNTLNASPLAAGLFHGAIGESGAFFDGMTHLSDSSDALPSAESMGVAIAGLAGADSIAELRDLSSTKLLQIYSKDIASGSPVFATRPNVDGWVLPDEIRNIFERGEHNDVPVIVGSNTDEMTSLTAPGRIPRTVEKLTAVVEERYPGTSEEFLKVYAAASDSEASGAYLASLRDIFFTLPMRKWAQRTSAGKSDAYLYSFTHHPPIANSAYFKSFHAAEIAYVFNNLERLEGANYTTEDHALADSLSSYWVNFATSGNPNGGTLPEWPMYSAERAAHMELGTTIEPGEDLLKDQLDFIERISKGNE